MLSKREREHNYIVKLRRLIASGAIPRCGVSDVDIWHDDNCAIFAGGLCNCDPDITLRGEVKHDDA